MTTWSSVMEERVDQSEAQSALRVVQALFAFVKKKKKIKLQHRAPSTPLRRGLGLY